MIHQAVFWCFGAFRTLVFTHSRVLPLKQAFLSSTYCTEANKEPINLGHIIQKWKALAINHASSCKPEPSTLARRSPKKCVARPYCVARILKQQQQQLVVVVFVTVHWQAQKPSAFLKVIRPGGQSKSWWANWLFHTVGPPSMRFSLAQIPLQQFLAYVRASGGFSG